MNLLEALDFIMAVSSIKSPFSLKNPNEINFSLFEFELKLWIFPALIKPKDRLDLYNAMKKYLLDESLLKKLSMHSRKDIYEKYQRENFHHFLLEEYKELLKSKNYN